MDSSEEAKYRLRLSEGFVALSIAKEFHTLAKKIIEKLTKNKDL